MESSICPGLNPPLLSTSSSRAVHSLPSVNPPWHITGSQSPQFIFRFSLGDVDSVCCKENIVTCILHYSITLNSFIAPQTFVFHLFIHLPDNHWFFFFTVSIVLPFFRMSYNWNQTVCSFSDELLSLSNMHLKFLHVYSWLYCSFLFSTELSEFSLSIHLLKDILVSSMFWKWWIKLL